MIQVKKIGNEKCVRVVCLEDDPKFKNYETINLFEIGELIVLLKIMLREG
jgi:hypothetical protein